MRIASSQPARRTALGLRSSVGSLLLASLASAFGLPATTRISVDSMGNQSDARSTSASISADARVVAFSSGASNLVAGDTNGGYDVFVRDVATGITTRVSVDSLGVEGDNLSADAQISADGLTVVFSSQATNLVPGDTNGAQDVFVRDLQTGQTTRISVDSSGLEANDTSQDPAVSADGRLVVFHSAATNLVLGDGNAQGDVFLHDRQTGQTQRVSIDSSGNEANGSSTVPAISQDGRILAFASSATNLTAGDTNAVQDVFVHDRVTGITTRVSVDSAGNEGDGISLFPTLSADGRHVAFTSTATNLVSGDTNAAQDVFVHDRQTGATERVSLNLAGQQVDASSGSPSISADARFVVFDSYATNLTPGDSGFWSDVFVHDRDSGETTRISSDGAGNEGNFPSGGGPDFGRAISADGRFVAFESLASNLVASDTNDLRDVFLRDRGTARISRFCFGDGSGGTCPCGNTGDLHHGCANSVIPSGGILRGYGMPSVGADNVLLHAQGLSGGTCIFFQGTAETAPTALDDGLGCVGGALIRLGTKAVVSTMSSYPQLGDLSVSTKGMIGASGGTRYYQCFYRNANPTFCTSATTNRTSGLTVVWCP